MGVRILKASVFVHFISLQVFLFHLINKVICYSVRSYTLTLALQFSILWSTLNMDFNVSETYNGKKGSYRYIYHYIIENILKSNNISWECIKRKYQINNLAKNTFMVKLKLCFSLQWFCTFVKNCHTYDVSIHAFVKCCPIYTLWFKKNHESSLLTNFNHSKKKILQNEAA